MKDIADELHDTFEEIYEDYEYAQSLDDVYERKNLARSLRARMQRLREEIKEYNEHPPSKKRL